MKGLFVRTKEKQYGPLSEFDLRKMIFEGRVTRDDLIWHYYRNIWVEVGRVEKFKPLFPDNNTYQTKKKVVSIGSGKGGVGKTALTASIGLQLAALGKKVVIVDADFSSPNLHLWLGINQPRISLQAFFDKRASLKDVVMKTSLKNLHIICGAPGNLGIANLKHFQTLRFIRLLHSLDADFVLVDLSPGASFKVVDLFLATDESIVVTLPEPTAIVDAFTFLKICLLRELKRSVKNSVPASEILNKYENSQIGCLKLSLRATMAEIQKVDDRAWSICVGVLKTFNPKLILNKVFNRQEDREGHLFKAALAELLLIQIDYLGYIDYDYSIREVSKKLRPFILADLQPKANGRDNTHHHQNRRLHRNTYVHRDPRSRKMNSSYSISCPTVGNKVFGDILESVELYSEKKGHPSKFAGITSLEYL